LDSIWVSHHYEYDVNTGFTIHTLSKEQKFNPNDYGVQFLDDDQVILHSSGWCGMPPIIYSDFYDNYTAKSDTIFIGVKQRITKKFIIIDISKDSLKVRYI
jgi:hypothetical protein